MELPPDSAGIAGGGWPERPHGRVTLVDDRRWVALVLPSTEPAGSLMPDLLACLVLVDGLRGPLRRFMGEAG